MESETFLRLTENFKNELISITSEEKKKEILNHFIDHYELSSKKEYIEIKPFILQACNFGDFELLDIILSKEIENKSLGMTFKINKINKTASLFKITRKTNNIIIPKSIQYETDEYLITSIINIGNQIIKSLQFDPQSQVHTFYENCFKETFIESLSIPDSLIDLKEGWNQFIDKLTKIIISPSNGHFIYKDDKYLLGKTDPQSDDFDLLLFARRDLQEAEISSNIKIIKSDAFSNCHNLHTVTFSKDSQLQIIEKGAFYGTKICRIDIPSSVTKICENCFTQCSELSVFKTEEDSKLETIEDYAFQYSKIKQIYFSANLKHLGKIFSFVKYLSSIRISPKNDQFVYINDKYLLGKTDPKSDNFDVLLFVCTNVVEFTVPSNIKVIGQSAFRNCHQLLAVNFQEDSKLEIIEKNAFAFTKISRISIPKTVTKICDGAFCCENLSQVEIPEDSNLLEIGCNSFSHSIITKIFIPPKVTTINDLAFGFCFDLQKIEISQNSNLTTIGERVFNFNIIEELFIPQNMFEMKDGWCQNANKLTKITISQLNSQFIYKDDKYLLGKTDPQSDNFDLLLFARSDLQEAEIPSNIKIIKSYAFSNCHKLHTVTFSKDSQLQIIGKNSFSRCFSLVKVHIPSAVTKICENAFTGCRSLQKVEIQTNSNLQTIEDSAFYECNINEIYIPSTVTIIGDKAFQYCVNLKKIEIQENSKLLAVGDFAFEESSIEEFYIPQNLIEIEEGCFCEAKNLKRIIISPFNNHFIYKENKFLIGKTNSNDFDHLLFASYNNMNEVIIPDNVKIIGLNTFCNSKASRISIPSSVTQIGQKAFYGCENLRVVDIPENSQLQRIGSLAFSQSNVSQIYIPRYIESISSAFYQSVKMFEVADKSKLVLFDKNNINFLEKSIITVPNI